MERLNNLTDLAALLRSIDNSPESKFGFDMRYGSTQAGEAGQHPCGSACCIGGWVVKQNFQHAEEETSLHIAVQSLQPDLDGKECYKLCFPDGEDSYYATPEQAARAVKSCGTLVSATGRVL